MKKAIFFLIGFLIFFLGSVVFALERKSGEFFQEGMLERVRERSEMTNREFEQNRAQLKNLREQNQLEFRNWLQNKREEMKIITEKKKAELKNRLQLIKNEQKQKIVERIYEQINKLNERMIDHYFDVLERLEITLEKIEDKTAKAKINGKDVVLVESQIAQAKTLMGVAKEEVKKQAEKVYELPKISGEETLRIEVGKLRQELHQDLKEVETMVKSVRFSVKEALIQLAQIPKIDELEVEATTQKNQ